MVHATLSCVWFLHQDELYRSLSSVQVADLLAPPPSRVLPPTVLCLVCLVGVSFPWDTLQPETPLERHKLVAAWCVDLFSLGRPPGFSINLCPIAQGIGGDSGTIGICWRRDVNVRFQPWQFAIGSGVKLPEIPQWQCGNVLDSMMRTLELCEIGVL